MMLNQEQQAPLQQTPLDATAQPIVEKEALNGQLEDIEAKDDNKDRDSDNNNEGKDNSTVNWLNHWSLRQEVQEALNDELELFLARGCNRNIQMTFCVTSNVPVVDIKILSTWHHIPSFETENCVLSTLIKGFVSLEM